MSSTTPILGLRAMLRILSARPAGAHSSDPMLARWTTKQIASQATKLSALGEVFTAKLSHREARYFASTEGRDAFIASHSPRPRRWRAGLMWKVAGRAPWADSDEPIITAATKITICPSHAPRYSAFEPSFIHG